MDLRPTKWDEDARFVGQPILAADTLSAGPTNQGFPQNLATTATRTARPDPGEMFVLLSAFT